MCRIKYKNCECCLGYTSVKDDIIEYKCLCYNKNCKKRSLIKTYKRDKPIYTYFPTMISISCQLDINFIVRKTI